MKNKKDILLLIIAGLLIGIFAILLFLVYNKTSLPMDNLVDVLAGNRTKPLNIFIKIITYMGSAYVVVPIAILLFVLLKDKKEIILLAGASALTALINIAIKTIVKRPRPIDVNLIVEHGFSFPSGHASLTITFYAILIYFVCKYIKPKALRYLLSAVMSCLILIVGFSRIYLAVHYTSDVIAGYALGAALTLIYVVVYKNIVKNKKMS